MGLPQALGLLAGDFFGVFLGLAFLGVGLFLGVAFLGVGDFLGVVLVGDLAGLLVGVDMGDNHLVTRGHVGVEQGTHTTNSTTTMGKQNCLTTQRCLHMG